MAKKEQLYLINPKDPTTKVGFYSKKLRDEFKKANKGWVKYKVKRSNKR